MYHLRPELAVGPLSCGTEYAVSIAAQNRLGTGPFTDPVHISTEGASKWTGSSSFVCAQVCDQKTSSAFAEAAS